MSVIKNIIDKDGVALTPEEVKEYEDDIWNNRTGWNKEVDIRMWEKWGKRLGLPDPRYK
jgi:hypothetical protein